MNFFDFINPKTSYLDSGLLVGMTDIHCHILPGVDDGVKTYEKAVKALVWLKTNGVRRMYLTPHIMSDFPNNTYSFLSKQFEKFINYIEDEGAGRDIPGLKLGAEYMLDAAFEHHKKKELLTYANKHVLVETSYMMPPAGFIDTLEQLMEEGFSPVLAHPERYMYMEMGDYESLRAMGVLFQVNFLSFTGAYGREVKAKAKRLLERGYYKYAGSDFHSYLRHEQNFLSRSLSKKNIESLKPLFVNNQELW